MGLFSGLEGNLEKYIEGFFKGKFKSRVQPVEVAKNLYREMQKNRRVSVNKTYVPNEYKVLLHPEDWESIDSFHRLLILELQDYLSQKAQEKELTLVASPVVKLEKNDDIKPGEMLVKGDFGEAVPVNRELIRQQQKNNEPEETDKKTMMYQPVKDDSSPEKPKTSYRLLVEKGRDAGKEFPLGYYRMVVGRRETCDIVLADPSISRRHAQLDNQNNQYVLTDLQSTNGTYVNGEKISKKMLEPGDSITFGTTECVFKVEQ
ncbi:MAG: DUF2662 domain-containing protein [Firmicutes bacterium]|nr:DUF2662 domain-containing protein [Bacillota bacterium]